MKISFQKQRGTPARGVEFFWKLTVESKSPVNVTDHFIPELFFDFFYIQQGQIQCAEELTGEKFKLPQQVLKTVYTRPLQFSFSTPLVLYGARLALRFAESFWGEAKANSFLKQAWVKQEPYELESFKVQVESHLQRQQRPKSPYPMFKASLDESDWLVNFSPRHKRRLYKTMFGLSRKELQNIRNVHAFLEQTCDFAAENPRIIRHVNPEVFYDQPHLNHTFKKMTGLAPVEYFEANSTLQDNLMSASYNEDSGN